MVAPSQQVYSDQGIALDGGRLIPHRPYAEAIYAAVKIEATCKYVRGWGWCGLSPSALGSGPRGRRFKSYRPDFQNQLFTGIARCLFCFCGHIGIGRASRSSRQFSNKTTNIKGIAILRNSINNCADRFNSCSFRFWSL